MDTFTINQDLFLAIIGFLLLMIGLSGFCADKKWWEHPFPGILWFVSFIFGMVLFVGAVGHAFALGTGLVSS